MCTRLPVMDLNNYLDYCILSVPSSDRSDIQSDTLVLTRSFLGKTGRSGGRGLSWCVGAQQQCALTCQLSVWIIGFRFTVFAPCCRTHRSDQRLTGHSGAFWRFLWIFFGLVLSPPASQIFKGVFVKYK